MLDLRRRGRPLATGLENGASRTQYWEWTSPLGAANHRYLVPGVLRALRLTGGRRVLDIGCGNGALTAEISAAGFTVTGIDFEPNGIEQARQAHPEVEFLLHDLCDPLPADLQGRFDVVLSAEVIEHLFLPRELFARARQALDGEGRVVVTTPYHGYAKNLALAITGRFDDHWVAQSDYGHIKFFSKRTLGELARECGVEPVHWARIGRVPPLAATMVMVGEVRRP
jgi:2-polyprenyl-3-methyl-5-hydroxy-6-metoxy-1,4-benzoquinol methylase